MKCHVCGGVLAPRITDLPFKLDDTRIVVIRSLPVVECGTCPEYLLEDDVLAEVDRILSGVGSTAELEVVRYAA